MPAKKSTPAAGKGAKNVGAKPAAGAKKAAGPKASTKKAAAARDRAVDLDDTAPPAQPAKRAGTAKSAAAADKFVGTQKATLLEDRATYTRQAKSLRDEADLLAAEREPGDVQFDEESGEGDTLAVERERDLALSAQAQAAVEDIDRALAKIDDGTYGICAQCGDPIPKERLKALPYAALCVRCKSGGLGRR